LSISEKEDAIGAFLEDDENNMVNIGGLYDGPSQNDTDEYAAFTRN
jgi:hypothetical protein